jgi:hypothetical protein
MAAARAILIAAYFALRGCHFKDLGAVIPAGAPLELSCAFPLNRRPAIGAWRSFVNAFLTGVWSFHVKFSQLRINPQ